MTKNLKIPKKIGGVKIPKKARKTVKKAIRMSAGPAIREIAAAAIGACGTRAAGERKDPDHGLRHIRGDAHIRVDAGKVGEAFRAAALDGLRRFLEGFEEGLRNIDRTPSPGGEQPGPGGASAARPGAGRD
jgi:hypothetical protein